MRQPNRSMSTTAGNRLQPSLLHHALAAATLEENIKKKKVNALKKALGLYSSRLGLEFRQSEGEDALILHCRLATIATLNTLSHMNCMAQRFCSWCSHKWTQHDHPSSSPLVCMSTTATPALTKARRCIATAQCSSSRHELHKKTPETTCPCLCGHSDRMHSCAGQPAKPRRQAECKQRLF